MLNNFCIVCNRIADLHVVVIRVGLSGAPQLGVIHPGAFVVEFTPVPEREGAELAFGRPTNRLAVSSWGGKASLHESKGYENALNEHV